MSLLVSTLTPAQNNCARRWANGPIQEVNARLRAYAEQHDIPFVDNYQAILAHGDGFFSDCLHFTDSGYQILAEQWFYAFSEHHIMKKSTP